MPDRDFPKVPDHRELTFTTVESAVLRDMIQKTRFSVCNDEKTCFHLNGVLFESNGKTAKMVSTDGHRLSKVDRTISGPTLPAGIIIPKKGLIEIKKLLKSAASAKIAVKTPHIYLVSDDVALAVKLIDAQFPPYEAVISKDHKKVVIVDRSKLIDALKRAQLMSSENRGVKFSATPGTLTITSDRSGFG